MVLCLLSASVSVSVSISVGLSACVVIPCSFASALLSLCLALAFHLLLPYLVLQEMARNENTGFTVKLPRCSTMTLDRTSQLSFGLGKTSRLLKSLSRYIGPMNQTPNRKLCEPILSFRFWGKEGHLVRLCLGLRPCRSARLFHSSKHQLTCPVGNYRLTFGII